jgi:prepilin-type N-terminal cleavage/methylation domain-containing protein
MINRNKTAFTLVELLAVIAIIGLSSVLVVAATSGLREQADIDKALAWSKKTEISLEDNLVGSWGLDKSFAAHESAIFDSSGQGNHGTLYTSDGSTNKAVIGVVNNALSFDGANDYVGFGVISQLTDYTQPISIECWLYVPSSYSWLNGEIASIRATSYGMGIYRNLTNNRLTFAARIGGVSSYGTQNYDIVREKYYHLVFSGNGTSFDAFVNGTKINTSPRVYGVLAGAQLNGDFRIATSKIYGGNAGGYLQGIIDEVRVYSAVLTAAQVQSRYYTGLNRLLAKELIDQNEYQKRIVIK